MMKMFLNAIIYGMIYAVKLYENMDKGVIAL
ncbi:hypothetical protein EUBDOL_01456 [Amedibacillus dolichus DSM 3991]|uniref:Uncharacterized protein n=1 Tax=Amedibacillus dolichus DSM 3991 TaxID=428127 RepID=A8RCN5_9FIRM|nr:hypothetical protein EUBDOL_01456 [Amedibacillus dolichus DSM 3991]